MSKSVITPTHFPGTSHEKITKADSCKIDIRSEVRNPVTLILFTTFALLLHVTRASTCASDVCQSCLSSLSATIVTSVSEWL